MVKYRANTDKNICGKLTNNFKDGIREIWSRTVNPEDEHFGVEYGFTAIDVWKIERLEERRLWGKIETEGWHKSDIIDGRMGEIRLPKLPGTVRVEDVIRVHTHPPDSIIGRGVAAFSIGDMIEYLAWRKAGWSHCLIGIPHGEPDKVEVRCIEKKGGDLEEKEADRLKEELKSVFKDKTENMDVIKASNETLEEVLGPISKFCRKDITDIVERNNG